MSIDKKQGNLTINQQQDQNNSVNQIQHHDSYLFTSFLLLIFILVFWMLIYRKKREIKKEQELLKNSININDLNLIDDDYDRQTIEEAIAENDIEFLKEALKSPILSEDNKKLVREYFNNKSK